MFFYNLFSFPSSDGNYQKNQPYHKAISYAINQVKVTPDANHTAGGGSNHGGWIGKFGYKDIRCNEYHVFLLKKVLLHKSLTLSV